MKKTIVTILSVLYPLLNCFAQDIITKKTGEDIRAKVFEVNQTDVKYKIFDDQNGDTLTLSKSEILMIRYENGSKDIFNAEQKNQSLPENNKFNDLYSKGQIDAAQYYTGYKGAGTGTLIAALVSPLGGLIPAIACSATTPKVENLHYPDPNLFKQPEYSRGYIKKAKRIKQGKIWTNWGIAFGANFIAVLILTSSRN